MAEPTPDSAFAQMGAEVIDPAAPQTLGSGGPDDAFERLGAMPETKEEALMRRLKDRYGDRAGSAFGLGVARGATFGLTDFLAKQAGLNREVAAIQELNPDASTAGEITGVVGSAFIPVAGQANIAAQIGTRATSRIASSVLRKAAAAGVEGALQGVGQTISEQSLRSSPDHIGQSLVANVGLGAMTGGVFSLGASGVGKVVKTAKNVGKGLIGKLAEGAETALEKEGVNVGDEVLYPELEDIVDQQLRGPTTTKNARLEMAAADEGVTLTPGMKSTGSFGRNLEVSLSKDPTLRGIETQIGREKAYAQIQDSAKNKLFYDAGKLDAGEVGQRIKDSMFTQLDEGLKALKQTFQDIQENQLIGTGITTVDDKLRGKAVKSFQSVPGYNLQTSPISSFIKHVENDLANISSVDEIQRIRAAVNDEITSLYRAGKSQAARDLGLVKTALVDLEEGSLIKGIRESGAGKEVAEDMIQTWQNTKKSYAEAFRLIEDVAESAGVRGKAPVALSKLAEIPNEKLAQKFFKVDNLEQLNFLREKFPEQFNMLRQLKIAQLEKASMTGEILDVRKVIKNVEKIQPKVQEIIFGKQGTRAVENFKVLMDRMPKDYNPSGTGLDIRLQGMFDPLTWMRSEAQYQLLHGIKHVEKVIQKQDSLINGKLGAFFNKAKAPVSQLGLATRRTITQGLLSGNRDMEPIKYNEISELLADPGKLVQTLSERTKVIAKVDPVLNQSIANTTMQAANYLYSKMPKNPLPPSPYLDEKWQPSDMEMATFNRTLHAVDQPLSILDDFEQGILTRESVEAVQNVYPELYATLVNKTLAKIGSLKRPLSLSEKLQVSLLTSMPLSSLQDPGFIMRLQQTTSTKEQEAQDEAQRSQGTKSFEVSGATPTGAQQISDGLES